jgi:hypothetical protein
MSAVRALAPLLFLVACTGTASVTIPETTEDVSPNEPAPTEDGIPTGSATAAMPTDAGADGGATPDAAPICAAEVEPNDSSATANAFTTCFSGVLSARGDRDFWVVVAPAGATSMQIAHVENAPIAYRVTESSPFGPYFPTSFTDEDPVIDVTPGLSYVFRLSATGPNDDEVAVRGYQVTATFE